MVPFEIGFLFAFHSNSGRIFNSFDTMHERDGRQTDGETQYSSI